MNYFYFTPPPPQFAVGSQQSVFHEKFAENVRKKLKKMPSVSILFWGLSLIDKTDSLYMTHSQHKYYNQKSHKPLFNVLC